MRIGEVAAASGVSVRALRYYEEQGLLASTRSAGGQRVYGDTAVERVRALQALYAAGMPSKAIVEVILPCMDDPSADHSDQVWTRMRGERDRIAADIVGLTDTRDALDRLIAEHGRYRDSLRSEGAASERL